MSATHQTNTRTTRATNMRSVSTMSVVIDVFVNLDISEMVTTVIL